MRKDRSPFMSLPNFPFPLPPDQPPVGYRWEERDISVLSTATAFLAGVDERDKFLGQQRCIVCGISASGVLQHCHIIGQAQPVVGSRTCN